MKGTASVFIVSLVAGIGLAGTPANAAFFNNSLVRSMIDGVTQAELEPYVMELTGEVPIGGRNDTIRTRSSSSGPSGIGKAEQFMYEKLQSYKLHSVSYQNYPGKGGVVAPGRNIIGQINGTTKPDQIVIISAHLDARPWTGDLSYGADDDASGCAAVLYLARSFADNRRFERTIRFIFFGSEENAPWTSSTYGSGYYAAQSRAAGENITAMVDADAVAWNGLNNGVVYMVTRKPAKDPGSRDLAIATMWQQAVAAYGIDGITALVQPSGDNLSDHGSFWKNGYPAVMLIEDDLNQLNPNWHTLNDRAKTLNWPYYVQVTKSLVAVAAHLAGISPP